MRRTILSVVGLMAFSACYGKPLTWQGNPVAVQRFYAETFQDQPFDAGNVSVLTEEHGELHTYLLRSCRDGTRVCGTRTGSVQKNADFTIVSGAYPGRTFYLSPGGDGYLIQQGRTIPLAWNED